MAADAKRCPDCGDELPANTPDGLCPRCLMRLATMSDPPGTAVDDDATTGPTDIRSGHSPRPTAADSEATDAFATVPAAGATSDDARDWTLDSAGAAETAGGTSATGDLPRGTMVRYFDHDGH
jgi:hypothetical protein